MRLILILLATVLCLSACADDPPTGEQTQSYCDYIRYKLEDKNYIEDPIIKQNVTQKAELLQEYHYFECDTLIPPLPR